MMRLPAAHKYYAFAAQNLILKFSGWNEPGTPHARLHVHDDVPVDVDLEHRHHRHDAPHCGRRGGGHQHQGGRGE